MKRTNTAVWMEKHHRWQINVQKDGCRRTFTCAKPGRTGQREANAKADAWLDDGIENVSQRVDILLDLYIKDLQARTSTTNWKGEEYRCRVWIRPQIGHRKISSLNDQVLQEIINNGYAVGGLSKKSLSNLRNTLTGFLKFCRKSKVTTYHPEDIVIPQGASVKEKSVLQPEHLVTLFSIDTTMWHGKLTPDPYINAYRFAVLTGLRPGELIGLRSDDIDGSIVKIRRAINVFGETTSGKNKNAIRSFIATPSALSVLQEQMKISDSPGASLFEINSESTYRHCWQRYCESNGIPYIPPYNLRHTFVSMAKNLPDGEVKSLVGHSRNMDTFGVYGHKINGQESKTAIRLEAIFMDLIRTEETG